MTFFFRRGKPPGPGKNIQNVPRRRRARRVFPSGSRARFKRRFKRPSVAPPSLTRRGYGPRGLRVRRVHARGRRAGHGTRAPGGTPRPSRWAPSPPCASDAAMDDETFARRLAAFRKNRKARRARGIGNMHLDAACLAAVDAARLKHFKGASNAERGRGKGRGRGARPVRGAQRGRGGEVTEAFGAFGAFGFRETNVAMTYVAHDVASTYVVH